MCWSGLITYYVGICEGVNGFGVGRGVDCRLFWGGGQVLRLWRGIIKAVDTNRHIYISSQSYEIMKEQ